MTQASLDPTASEYARVAVLNPSCELAIGKSPDAFVGVRLITDTGQAFLSAGGAYETAASGAATLGAMYTLLPLLFGAIRFGMGGAGSELLGVGVSGLFGALSVMSAIAPGSSGAPGNALVYGKSGVTITTPGALAVSGGAFASLSGGAFASMNAVVSANVFGVLGAALGGGLSATVSAMSVTAEGQSSARLASQRGDVTIEGARLIVGRRGVSVRKGVSAVRRRAFGQARQAPTKSIALEAEDQLSVEVGGGEAPARFVVLPTGIVAQGKAASISIGTDPTQGSVEVAAGKSAIHVAWDALTLGRLAGKPTIDREETQSRAKRTRDTAVDTAEAGVRLGAAGFLAPVVVGGATAYGVASLAGSVPIAAAATIPTTAIAYEVATALARRKADKAIAAAETIYAKALVDAQATFEQAVRSGLTQPGSRPSVRINDTSVVIQVGTSTVTIKDGEISFAAKQIKASAKDSIDLKSADVSLEGTNTLLLTSDMIVER